MALRLGLLLPGATISVSIVIKSFSSLSSFAIMIEKTRQQTTNKITRPLRKAVFIVFLLEINRMQTTRMARAYDPIYALGLSRRERYQSCPLTDPNLWLNVTVAQTGDTNLLLALFLCDK
jgi:hypothetical protein